MIRNSERKQIIHCNLMSSFLAAAYNPQAAIVFHTPKSCSHIAYNIIQDMKFTMENCRYKHRQYDGSNLFVTGISDKETIFGGEKILKECLQDVAELCKPQYILVVSGCAAGVIGDDIAAVCSEVEQQTQVPILYVEGCGFMAQKVTDGFLSVTKAMCQRFVYPQRSVAKKKNAMAVLGINTAFSKKSELEEVNRLLGLFGFTEIYYPPSGMSLEEFKKIAAVSAISVVNFLPQNFVEFEKFAKQFAEIMKVTYIKLDIPTTMDSVYKWLQMIGASLGRCSESQLIVQQEKSAYDNFADGIKRKVGGKNYIFAISLSPRFFAADKVIKILDGVGMNLQGVVFCDELTNQEKQQHYQMLSEKLPVQVYAESDLPKLQADILLTTMPKKSTLPQYCISYKRIGRSGIENFLNRLVKTLESTRTLIYETS